MVLIPKSVKLRYFTLPTLCIVQSAPPRPFVGKNVPLMLGANGTFLFQGAFLRNLKEYEPQPLLNNHAAPSDQVFPQAEPLLHGNPRLHLPLHTQTTSKKLSSHLLIVVLSSYTTHFQPYMKTIIRILPQDDMDVKSIPRCCRP